MGLLIRYLHARPPWKRIAGGAVLVGSLCWTALYNLGVAHYRDVSSRILDESGRIFDKSVDERVLTQLINDPLGLNGVASWALFSLGVFFSAIACVTGYRLDDRIPGYGRLHRRGEEKREDLEQKGRDALEDFRRVQTDTLNLIRDDDAVASDRVRAIAMAVQEREALLKSVGNSEDYIRKFGTAILGRYQDLNSQARQTSPPSYFGEQLPVVKATLNEQSDRYRRKAQSEKYELKKLREKQSAFEAAVTEKTESMLEFIKDLTSKLLLHGPRPLDVDAHGDKQSE
jgi:hypothetical protein